jgi:hypothetical protein
VIYQKRQRSWITPSKKPKPQVGGRGRIFLKPKFLPLVISYLELALPFYFSGFVKMQTAWGEACE